MTLRPLPLATLFLLAGLVPALRYSLPDSIGLIGAATIAALWVVLPAARSHLALLACTAAGIALGQAAARSARDDCRAGIPDGARIEVFGTFAATPTPGGAAPFRLERIRAGTVERACGGEVRARLRGRGVGAEAGAAVVGWGQWIANPPDGEWSRPADRAGTLHLDSLRLIPPSGEAERYPLLAARGRAQELLRRLLPRHAGLAEALLLAHKGAIDMEQRDRFAAAGLAHLLAISGLHVGLIAGVLLLLGRVLRAPPALTGALAVALTGAYVLFLGAPHAAARAALQIGLVLGSRLGQRPADPYSLLATAALALLAFDPHAILDPGFQLSFAGVAGILALRRRLLEAIPIRRGKAIRESLATSIAATVATSPITVLHFGQIAPIGIVANLVAIPITGFAVPALALALGVGAIAEPAGRFLAGAAEFLLGVLDASAKMAAAVPAGHLLVPRDQVLGWAIAALLGALTAGRLAHRRPTAGRGIRTNVRRIAATSAALALLIAWPTLATRLHDGALEIHVIDVGQGDAIAIRSPAGRWLLVDAGPRGQRYDAGRARVVPFLLRHGARRLEALILTHPDADHIGGAAAVIDALPLGAIVDPGVPTGKSLYLELLRGAERKGIRWIAARAGRQLDLDGVAIHLLHPREPPLDGSGAANEVSVAFRLEYGRFRALFLGDAPAAVEEALVARDGRALEADVLKVAHHGSATSTSEALLSAAAPRIALVSVGRGNRYGHPDPDVLARLDRHGVQVLRTDRVGTITLRVRPDGRLDVRTER